ncbi:MAG: GDSL-type esterase/lipase family protein [Oscillospiraceae bacterium]
MKNILCFGDSNTYGLRPDQCSRYEWEVRYPGVLQKLLGEDYHVIEEGCSGRTTIFHDPTREGKRGIDYIAPCVQSHLPLDWVIIMLGTNDCKTVFKATAHDIAEGLRRIVASVKKEAGESQKIMIVSPIILGDEIEKFDLDFIASRRDVSLALAHEYQKLAEEEGCVFFDAASAASSSDEDREHMTPEGHTALAKSLADKIMKI